MSKKYKVAIVGASGVVGETIFQILHDSQFPIEQIYLLGSERSAGECLTYKKQSVDIQPVDGFDFSDIDIAFFSAGGEVSKEMVPIATQQGAIVIDNTSCFRYEDTVPLVIPEINSERIAEFSNRNIIANPNCSTIQMLVALKPIYEAVGIQRIDVATYQSVSGSGRAAISELIQQTGELLNGRSVEPNVYPQQIAFNVFPHIDEFDENGYTREEMKMLWETRKIFEDPEIQVNATAVRVPVLYGHSEAISIETQREIGLEEAIELLKHAPGVHMMGSGREYSTPMQAVGNNEVYVGRVRKHLDNPYGLNLWVVADNIRKGAALNSVQIAWKLVNQYL